jgi:hypothetical protein
MTNRIGPKWFTQWLALRAIEEEDAYYDRLTPSEEMFLNGFITEARRHFRADLFDAEGLLTENRRFEDELRGAIEAAHAAGEPWVRLDALDVPAWLLPDAPPLPGLRPGVPPPGAPLPGWLNGGERKAGGARTWPQARAARSRDAGDAGDAADGSGSFGRNVGKGDGGRISR